jgi:hypothetical protein
MELTQELMLDLCENKSSPVKIDLAKIYPCSLPKKTVFPSLEISKPVL